MEKNKARVLVTGGTGFIGAHIIRALIAAGYQHIFCTHRKNSRFELLDGILDQVELVETDISDLTGLIDCLSTMDYIVHAAAVISFDPSDKAMMYKTNVEGTANIVNIALESPVKKMVHLSSIAALGRSTSREPIDENAKWVPGKMNSYYALTKNLAEREVWRGYQEGLPVVILNPSNVIGPGFWQNSTPRLVDQVYRGLPYFPPGTNGFVDVRDVAEMTVLALESGINGERIICNGENATFEQVFRTMATTLKVTPPTRVLPAYLGGLIWRYFTIRSWFTGRKAMVTRETLRTACHSFTYDNSKSKDLFGFRYRELNDTIQHTCNAYLDSMKAGRDYAITKDF
jgi:nucleoside-diphosphate-sugar epimerase